MLLIYVPIMKILYREWY